MFLVAVLYLPDFTSLNVGTQGCQGRAELIRKVPVLFLLVQSYHQWIADSNNRLFLGFQCRKSGAFSWSWIWLCVPTASQSQGFSWLCLLVNSNAWGYSCQGCGGHVGMWQYPTYVSQIKWLIHKENLSHSRSHAEAECWLDCKHPVNGWTHCNPGHFKQIFFGVWAQILRQDEMILCLSGVKSGVWKLSVGPCSMSPAPWRTLLLDSCPLDSGKVSGREVC